MSGVGGGLMLIRTAGQDQVLTVDATMQSARNADPGYYPLTGGAPAPDTSEEQLPRRRDADPPI